MTVSTGIPKRIEEVLTTHRRGFLKIAGLLVVRFAAGAEIYKCEAKGKTSYQDHPCAGASKDANIVEVTPIQPVNSGSESSSPPGTSEWIEGMSRSNRKRYSD